MVGFECAVHRDATSGRLDAGSDASDVRFWTAGEWSRSGARMQNVTRRRYGTTDTDQVATKTLAELD